MKLKVLDALNKLSSRVETAFASAIWLLIPLILVWVLFGGAR
jgi:hypothetical protein